MVVHSSLFRVCTEYGLPSELTAWSEQEFDIVQTLAIRVRAMTANQAGQIWTDQECNQPARDSLLRLCRAELLEHYRVNVHPLLQPTRPLFRWHADRPDPDCRALSDKARRRWCLPSEPTDVFVVSKKGANLFGGESHGLPPLDHRDHDLLLSDAYVRHRVARRNKVEWIGEDFLPKAGFRTKDPDAFLVDAEGYPTCVIESGGRYSSKQIEAFHDFCICLDLPYELW